MLMSHHAVRHERSSITYVLEKNIYTWTDWVHAQKKLMHFFPEDSPLNWNEQDIRIPVNRNELLRGRQNRLPHVPFAPVS